MPCPDGLSSHSKETFILQQFPGANKPWRRTKNEQNRDRDLFM